MKKDNSYKQIKKRWRLLGLIKRMLKFMVHRVVIVALMILVQILLIFMMVIKFNEYFVYFYAASNIIGLVLIISLINKHENPSYKIAWMIPILFLPIFGVTIYFIFGGNRLSNRTKRKMSQISNLMKSVLEKDTSNLEELNKSEDLDALAQSNYITHSAFCPPYKNTSVQYFPLGDYMFEPFKEELKKAKRYIFLEYFIIESGVMWDSILDILAKKVREGVDVRVIYDDMGTIMLLPYNYKNKLQSLGIKCQVFNPFVPVLSAHQNNRDHRKIAVIDGAVAFTGGINLADEYINAIVKHGHWKDTAVMLKGEAAWSFTVMFLTMWDYLNPSDTPETTYDHYRPSELEVSAQNDSDAASRVGFVQPYADNPLDNEAVGETIYINMISRAKKYVYINTPYLIIDYEMTNALCTAAKSGVDVRITTPHIPDKLFVHAATQSCYEVLVKSGVKIYEYTPGFDHAKTFVCDDKYATVGSVNLDYRSLFLHFECGVWMYNTNCIQDMKNDYLKTLEKCELITMEYLSKINWFKKMIRAVIVAFAPLM